MTTLLVQAGDVINYSTSAAVTVGTLVLIGSLPAVALESKAATTGVAPVACATEGVFTCVKKAQATALAQGGRAYYVTTGGINKICSTAAAGKMVGTVWEAATTTSTTCVVKLLGGAMPLETQT
ncbi:MAG: DUF2190 family protein [Chromatiaceae bacterium]|nr:DUF2190 family protein [Candidatus Thioaporhodococcus sediminis]